MTPAALPAVAVPAPPMHQHPQADARPSPTPAAAALPPPTRSRSPLWFVLLLGAILRTAICWAVVTRLPARWFYTRGLEMGLLADALVHHHGLSSPFSTTATGPTAMVAPGYPLLIAAIFRLLGSYTTASLVAILALHVALNLVTLWLLFHLARRLATERAALLATLLWACSPPLLWMPTIFWETSFSACLPLAAIALALRLSNTSARLPGFALFGTLCAVAGLLNPALLPSLLTIGAVAVWRARSGRVARLAVLLLSFALLYAPWPLRNAQVFHAWIPTRTTVGFELWMGNRDGADGFLDQSVFPTYNPAELHHYLSAGELAYFAEKQALALHSIHTHPARFLRLTLIRVWRFWSGTGNRNGSPLFPVHALCTTLLGALGLPTLLRSRSRPLAQLLLIPLLLFPLPYYITHAEFRYRLNVDPVLTVLAAAGLDRCLRRRTPARPAPNTHSHAPAVQTTHYCRSAITRKAASLWEHNPYPE